MEREACCFWREELEEEEGRRNDGLDAEGVGGCYVDCFWGVGDGGGVLIIFRLHSWMDPRTPR